MHRGMIMALAVVAGPLVASPAQATVLNPGDTGKAPDVYSSIDGTLVAGPVTVSNTGSTTTEYMNASVTEWVYRDNTTHHLDFVYQLMNNSNVGRPAGATPSIIEHLTVASFAGASTDVGFVSGSNTAPTTVDRSSSFNQGQVVTFDYTGNNPLIPGNSTNLLVVKTGYDYYNFKGSVGMIDGQTITVTGYQPLATPEPSTMALTGLGALGFAGYALRRRKARGA